MDDREFLDLAYSQWAKTTGAENEFWIVEEDTKHYAAGPGTWNVWSANSDDDRSYVGSFNYEEDADFICGLHGAVADLVRRMHSALDEADRADRERDEQEQSIFALAVENDELRQEVGILLGNADENRRDISDLQAEVQQLRRERESWVSRAGDALWKIERPM